MLIDRDKAIEAIDEVRDLISVTAYCAITERLKELPSAERTVAHIRDFTQYQIAWLTEHDDLELEPKLESWVIRFLKDTADCYEKEYLTSAERKGKWVVRHPMRYDGKFVGADTDIIPDTRIRHLYCGECDKQMPIFEKFPYCPYCGARMEGEEDE